MSRAHGPGAEGGILSSIIGARESRGFSSLMEPRDLTSGYPLLVLVLGCNLMGRGPGRIVCPSVAIGRVRGGEKRTREAQKIE